METTQWAIIKFTVHQLLQGTVFVVHKGERSKWLEGVNSLFKNFYNNTKIND
jgi:hypothetical protein